MYFFGFSTNSFHEFFKFLCFETLTNSNIPMKIKVIKNNIGIPIKFQHKTERLFN